MKFKSLFLVVALGSCGHVSMPGAPTPVSAPLAQPGVSLPAPPTTGAIVQGAWSDSFDAGTLSNRWLVSDYSNTIVDRGQAFAGLLFSPANVDLSLGLLELRLSQQRTASGDGVVSSGAELRTVERYGFGTYTWVMRVSTTSETPDGPGRMLTGQTSAGFLYYNHSETEIDFEHEGAHPSVMHYVTWSAGHNQAEQQSQGTFDNGFHAFSAIWEPQSVRYFVDGQQTAVWTKNVPQSPAYVMVSHWGSNNTQWGGPWTDGTRYVWVRSVSFTP